MRDGVSAANIFGSVGPGGQDSLDFMENDWTSITAASTKPEDQAL